MTDQNDQQSTDAAADGPADSPAGEKKGFFSRLRKGMSRSSDNPGSTGGLFTKRVLDDETLERLEDLLIGADLGADTAMEVADTLRDEQFAKNITAKHVREALAKSILPHLQAVEAPLDIPKKHDGPFVILFVGVNGTGKTTTIGKLAQHYQKQKKSVMLAAGDTFRAAAIEQLTVWGQRAGVPVVAHEQGSDSASLAFDAMTEAQEKDVDILMIDTAGRLQNKTDLMAELEKMLRVIRKINPDAPHAVLQVLDATTGQNALNQVEAFRDVADVTGLVMTKLDGTAKGGIMVPLARKFKMPVHYIGVGESPDDLHRFEAKDFARALTGAGSLT